MNWQNYFFSGMDKNVSECFHAAASARGTEFFSLLTRLGDWELIVFLAAIAVFLFWKYGKRDYIIPFGIAIIGGQFSGFVLKKIFARPRPEWGIHAGQFDSFPSGHAALSVLFFGFLAYFIFKNAERKNIKITALTLGVIIILAIGFSRLYLGAHYMSDVIAGYALGLVWVSVGFFAQKKYFAKQI